MADKMTVVGARIKGLRVNQSLEQIDLANGAGLSRAYVSRLENGIVLNPKVLDLARIAAVLGTTISYLLGEVSGGTALRALLTPMLGPQQAEKMEKVVEEILDWPPDQQERIIALIYVQAFNWPGRPIRFQAGPDNA